MTPLTKPVTRLTAIMVRDGGPARLLVATLNGRLLELRLHGRRQVETVDLEACYFGAIKARKWGITKAKVAARKEKQERAAGARALKAMSRRAMAKGAQ
jgi:hypothetical protein